VIPILISYFIMLRGLKDKGALSLACRARKATASSKRKPGGLLPNQLGLGLVVQKEGLRVFLWLCLGRFKGHCTI